MAAVAPDGSPRRVGIVGCGHLGKYLAMQVLQRGRELGLELAFVWNRTPTALDDPELSLPAELKLLNLDDFATAYHALDVECCEVIRQASRPHC